MDLPVMPPVKPMLAKAAKEVPAGDYLYEPKWDGFRCLVFRDGDEVELASRNSKPLTRYFPELWGPITGQLPEQCVLDGELVIPSDHGLDFDLLSQRIHPADSRVQRLAEETPAHLVLFDILALDGLDLRALPLARRRPSLVELLEGLEPPLHLTPATTDQALATEWFGRFDGGGFDGVMAKPLDGTYQEDKRAQVKVKHHRSVDCVVAGYAEHRSGGVGSLKLGLFDEGSAGGPPRLHHVGVCSAFSAARRRTLAAELAPLAEGAEVDHPWGPVDGAGEPPDGTRVPGAPNRWSGGRASAQWIPLRPERVVEVTCENVSNGRFRHPARFLRWRPDREPGSCSLHQLDTPVPAEFEELFGS
jgi:ATP-dependent DNA ligase